MEKRYAICITDDDGGTGEMSVTACNKTEARKAGQRYIRAWSLPHGKIDYIRELAKDEKPVPFGRAPGY